MSTLRCYSVKTNNGEQLSQSKSFYVAAKDVQSVIDTLKQNDTTDHKVILEIKEIGPIIVESQNNTKVLVK